MYKLKTGGINGTHLDLNQSFPCNRHQRDVLNGQSSNLKFVKPSVAQASVLRGPLFFHIYINDLLQGFLPDTKLLTDDAYLSSTVNCAKASASTLKKALLKIKVLACQWKVSFNLDQDKQAQEVIFSRKTSKSANPPLYSNDETVYVEASWLSAR